MRTHARRGGNIKARIIPALLVILLALGSGQLPAAGLKRGATVRVTLVGGRIIEGELLAVKERSLLVYDSNACQGYIIGIEQVARVRLVKKSKFLQGGLYGNLVGLGVATYFNTIGRPKDSEGYEGLLFFFLPPIFGIPGAVMGAAAGLDEEVILTRQSAEDLDRCLKRLSRFARERGWEGLGRSLPVVNPVPDLEASVDRYRPMPAPPKIKRPRFRLTWSGGYLDRIGQFRFSPEIGTFRFLDKDSPAGGDSHSFTPRCIGVDDKEFMLGRFDVDLTSRFSFWVDFTSLGTSGMIINSELRFYDAEQQREYESHSWIDGEYSASTCLVGLSWRTSPVSFFRRNIFELGVAAGPAWVHANLQGPYDSDSASISKFTANTWAWKAQVAFDHFYNDRFSLGCFVEYLSFKAGFPSVTYTGKKEFWPVDNYQEKRFSREIEYTIPGYRLDFSGLSYGLRASLRF